MSLRAWSVLAAIATIAGLSSTGCVGNNSTTGTGGETGGTNPGGGGATTSTTGGGGTGGATTSSTSSSSSSTITGCQTNADCVGDPAGAICDSTTGNCVACLPAADPIVDCGPGQWCSPAGKCEAGCTGDADCVSPNNTLFCDLGTHACVGCLDDSACPAGSICVNQTCIAGCNDAHPCVLGQSCCGQQCFDLTNDENNCGACNNA